MKNNKWVLCCILALILSISLALPAFGAQNDALIKASELNELLGNEGIAIIDIRDTDDYHAGHIPEAISVQKSEFYEDRDGVSKMAAGPNKFSALLSNSGINKDTRVIIYASNQDLKYVTRAWWVFHMYGHQNAQVLDGGIDNWTSLGYDLTTEAVTPSQSDYTVTVEDVEQDTVATIEEVKAAQESGAVIIDCRNIDYFQGSMTATARAGQIAGAILINQQENLNSDLTYKSAKELAEVYNTKGITEDTPVITYCNTGTTATVHYLALSQILGYENIQNFDASLMGWAQDPSLPMESSYDYFTLGSSTATINTVETILPAPPVAVDGHIYVNAQALADSLEINLQVSDENIVLSSDSKNLELNNQLIKENNTLFLPIRYTAEAFGASVAWDNDKKTVSLFLP